MDKIQDKRSPLVTFAISSQGVLSHLSRILASLGRLPSEFSFEVIIGSTLSLRTFQSLLDDSNVSPEWIQVHDPNLSIIRNSLYRRAQGRYVYFVDEDCELTDGFCKKLNAFLTRNERKAYGGFYRAPHGGILSQKAYNSMANLWLKVHRAKPLILAGNALVPKLESVPREFPFALANAFGGEEMEFCDNLRRQGIALELSEELTLNHHCQHTPKVFYQRALLHGRSDYRPVPLGSAIVSSVSHFFTENPAVTFMVLSYALTVRGARLWNKLWQSSYVQVREVEASIDSYPSL